MKDVRGHSSAQGNLWQSVHTEDDLAVNLNVFYGGVPLSCARRMFVLSWLFDSDRTRALTRAGQDTHVDTSMFGSRKQVTISLSFCHFSFFFFLFAFFLLLFSFFLFSFFLPWSCASLR